jgi:hypothetical protein
VCKPVSTTTKVTGLGTTYDVPSGDDCMVVLLHSFCLVSLFSFIVCVYVCMFSCASAYFVVGLQAVESARKSTKM